MSEPRLALFCDRPGAAGLLTGAVDQGVRLLDLSADAPRELLGAAGRLVRSRGVEVLLRVPGVTPGVVPGSAAGVALADRVRGVMTELGVGRLHGCVVQQVPEPADLEFLTGVAERVGVLDAPVGDVLELSGLGPARVLSYHVVRTLVPSAGGWGVDEARIHGTIAHVRWSPDLSVVGPARVAADAGRGLSLAQIALGLPLFTPGVSGVSIDPVDARQLRELVRVPDVLNPDSHLMRAFVDALGSGELLTPALTKGEPVT